MRTVSLTLSLYKAVITVLIGITPYIKHVSPQTEKVCQCLYRPSPPMQGEDFNGGVEGRKGYLVLF